MVIRLLLKLTLLGLPWMLLAFALAGISWHTGEIVPVATVVEWQHKDRQLVYGKAGCSDIVQYKAAAYEKRRPRILIFGNSLTLFVRARFFTKQPDAFYNASGAGWVLEHLSSFYDLIELPPSILILLVDLSWFNGDKDLWSDVRMALNRSDCNVIHSAATHTISRLAQGQLTLMQLLRRTDSVSRG